MVKDLKIETDRLIIRAYKEEDMMECFQLMQDKELFTYLDMEVMSLEEYKKLFKWLISCYNVGFDRDFKYSFNIVLKETGEHIGWCGIGGSNINHSIKEIYYLIGRKYWRNGYAKEASKALLDYGFKVMDLEEITAMVDPENIASKKVIENMGLKYKKIVNGLPEKLNHFNGHLFYSLLRREYFNIM
jgi:Acetyltransferases, including N-acetylases of ribosomal proteins